MTNSLKKFASWNDKNQFEIDGRIIIPHFDGVSCWERCHPTFISKKRKVILTAPRKVGHSSIRFYFNYQNEMFDDDWVWIEDDNRDPKTWLNDDEYKSLVESIYKKNGRIVLVPEIQPHHNDTNSHTANAELIVKGSQDCKDTFGEYNQWDYAASISDQYLNRDNDMTPPFQTLPLFEDWTSYLLVRDPWDRFISGLITEMDNGIGSPWLYDSIANSEEGWEKYYNSAKRLLYFTDPEWLLLGGLDGQQMNHTFILSRPLWNGKSMFETYDKFIDYKHGISFKREDDGRMIVDHDSMHKNSGVIGAMVELGFVNDEVRVKFQENDSGNMHSHTHMNVTPHIRQHVISELQADEDLKEWWEKCNDIVALDSIQINQNEQKFQNT